MSTTHPNVSEPAADATPHHVAHHFESAQQEFDAGKLGIWIFLVTEVLFFGGLFVAYAVYRSNHPEVFVYAHQFLDKNLGAINTVVLILSSLSMAWAVRCAQLGQKRGLLWCLTLTLICAGFFLGVKAVEYSAKWDEGLLWAGSFNPNFEHHEGFAWSRTLVLLASPAWIGLPLMLVAGGLGKLLGRRKLATSGWVWAATLGAFLIGAGMGHALPRWLAPRSATDHHGHVAVTATSLNGGETKSHEREDSKPPALAGVFFSIYFVMTGIHAVHILAGMGVIGWLVCGSCGGRFGPRYFAPVEYVGLYWHVVDLVWIFLFPLLYLIH